MSAFFHLAMALPGLRRLVLGPVQAPPEPEETAHHCFTKTGEDGKQMVLVIFANANRALETITVGGEVTSETTTPLGRQQLAVWYAQRYAQLLGDGWEPSFVSPPVQVPSHP
ncbi:hypothetical protein [Microbispora sp. GKU 823]|uniref:hypothetical protein n=1 Tax=Microbispora sp. GKU 823 TaxID=1652100 RepID=UPI0009A428E1|nr:hypothetical protein [Microbispora sp. GKU 823]OPG10590.1 hypothetical protein B1L11_23315 [Microbispora sp. GKU 823]